MTTTTPSTGSVVSPWAPGARVRNARRLLEAGLVGGHAAAAAVVGIALLTGGPTAAASAAMAAVATIAFFAIGQGVQVMVADSDPRRVFLAAMGSYFVRVGLLGGLLVLAMRLPALAGRLVPGALFAGAVVTLLGWLTVELLAWRRLRIPLYDTEYVPPARQGEAT